MATDRLVSTKPQPAAAQAMTHQLLVFMVCFAVALVSGLFYYLAPHDWNWTTSQAALWVHLIFGVAAFVFLIPFVLAHSSCKQEAALNLILLWRAFRRRDDESDWSYQQRIFGHFLNWLMALLGLSGLILALPGILWLGGVTWMAGYPAYQIANLTHLGLALSSLALIGLHIARKKKRANQR